MSIGIKFFILQLTSLLLFNLGNYIVYNFFGTQVIYYDTINKIYTNILMIFNISIAIYWTQYSSAIGEKNFAKFQFLREKLRRHCYIFIVSVILVSLLVPTVIKIWTTNRVSVTLIQIIPFAVLAILQAINYLGAVVLNATGKVTIQIIISLISCFVFFLLSFCLLKFIPHIDYLLIPISVSITLIPGAIIFNIDANKIEVKLKGI